MVTEILGAIEASADVPIVECDGQAVPRREFLRAVRMRADSIRDLGMRPGERVAVMSGRGGHFWIDLVAVWAAGGSVVPVDASADEGRRERMFAHLNPHWLLGNGEPRRLDGDAQAKVGIAAALFTSGSTGLPSAVELSNEALFGNAKATAERLPANPATRLAIAIPFHFTSAICHFLFVALRGGTLVCTERRLLPADFIKFIRGGQADAFGGSPLQVRWLADAPDVPIQWMMSSGDRLAVEAISAVRAAHPRSKLFVVYGLTELGGRLCILDPDLLDEAAGSVGRPIRGSHITVRGDSGELLAPGEAGEVYAASNYLATGYVGDPVKTRDRFTPHGFRTGDIGWLDERGLLWLKGRNDDVFKCSGQKVDGGVIAETLVRSGLVRDAAVTGVPDEALGAVPHALVVTDTFDREAIIAYARKNLPPNHVPRGIVRVDAIPRTGSGKVDRATVRSLLVGVAHPRR